MQGLCIKSAGQGVFALIFLACSASGQAPTTITPPAPDIHVVANPTYVTIPVEVTVNRPASELWARVGKFFFLARR